jgi:hypothetical protein
MSKALQLNDGEDRELRLRAEELRTRVEQLGRFL